MVEQTNNEFEEIAGTTWGILKQWAMLQSYKEQSWYKELTPEEVDAVERLRARACTVAGRNEAADQVRVEDQCQRCFQRATV